MSVQKEIEKLKNDINELEENKKHLSNEASIIALDNYIHNKRRRMKFLIDYNR